MPSVNADSLREEVDACEERFRELDRQGKVSPEVSELFGTVQALMRLLTAAFSEKTTRKGPGNSGIPGSQVPSDATAGRSGTNGKGPERKVPPGDHVRHVTERVESPVSECSGCGLDLSGTEPDGTETRELRDIVFEVRTRRVEAEIRTCPRCRTETRGSFPENMPGPLQYGPGIVAFAVNLTVGQMVPLRRAAEMLEAMTGIRISEATLLEWPMRVHDGLADWERLAGEKLLAAPALHVDETSIRISGKKHWMHSCSAGDLTLAFRHPRRGSEAMDGIGLIPRYGGVLVHDRWASYLRYDGCGHSLCGAHLARDLQFVIESNGHSWARNMKGLLLETAGRVRDRENGALSEKEFRAMRRRYRTVLTRGRRELPEQPKRISGRRGRIARTEAENLHEAFTRHEDKVLRFAWDPNVPFTNNRSERDIRMAKVKQKVSGCFRSGKHADAYCRISGYLKSRGYMGYDPLTAIHVAIRGEAAKHTGETVVSKPAFP